MNGYIDFNSEILSNPEDKKEFLSRANNIMKVLQAAKIKTVVSTTKFKASDDIENYLETRKKAYDILEENFRYKNYPKILLGSEVVFSQDIININAGRKGFSRRYFRLCA